jgi:O-antigen ligase
LRLARSPAGTPSVGREPGIPDYGFSLACAAVTCALAPWYTVRWHYGFYPTTLLETAIVLTVAIFLFESRLAISWRTPFTIPAVLFVLAGVAGVIVSPDHRGALGLWRAYIVEPVAFFFVIAAVAQTARRAFVLLAGLGVSGLGVAIPNAIVVLQALFNHTLNPALAPPVAIYQTANAVALFLVPLIAVAGSLLVYSRDNRVRLGSAIFLLGSLPAVLLSLSRGGYVALASVALILALTHRHRLFLVLGLVVAGLAVTRIPPIGSRIGHVVRVSDPYNSLVGRFPLWRTTLHMLRDHPIFGAGLSGFAQTLEPYWNGTVHDRLIYPHNILLNFWTETGILGVIAFGWILVQAFRTSWRGWRRGDPDWRPVHLGVFLALIAVVVHGLVDVPYWKNDLSFEFWMLLGLTWAGTRWVRRQTA